jgi:hypothetical protein
MKADAQSLAVTFNHPEADFYTIPQYQRPYTWDISNFETLWEDLTEAFEEFSAAKSNGKEPGHYFLGPVVFVLNKSNRSYDIIDGQQRTTTFHILLWHLYRKLNDTTEKLRIAQLLKFLDKEPRLKVSAKDATVFLKIRQSDADIEGGSKMAICSNFFRKKITTLTNPDAFSAFLREGCQFITIVADDYAKAWDLFIGLNGKGEPLNPTDLVKAFVCGRSDIGESAGAVWEEKILPLKENSTSFLLFLSRYKSGKFISENSLFREFSNLFPSTINTLDIAGYSEIYHVFWLLPIDEIHRSFESGFSLSLASKKSLKTIRDIGRKDITTLLFQFAQAFGKKSLFDEDFLSVLAAYQLRMALARKRSRERNFVSWFNSINFNPNEESNLIENKKVAVETIRKKLRTDAPDDATFETLIRVNATYGNLAAKIILRSQEEGERGNKRILDFELEHLMPQTGTAYWFPHAEVIKEEGEANTEDYSKLVNNIGNLFLIDPETNNEVKNFDFSVKRKFYQEKLSDWSVARITHPKTEWTKKDIEERGLKIARWAVGYWQI